MTKITVCVVEFRTLVRPDALKTGELDRIIMFATIYLNDHLQEQIEIYRSMLYREEFLPPDPHACEHCGPLLRKIKILQEDLASFENQAAA